MIQKKDWKNVLILENGKVVDYGSKTALFKKYCGDRIISFSDLDFHEELMKDYKKIEAPEGRVVISIENDEEELKLEKILVQKDIDFERTRSDMEVMYINALRRK